MIKICIIDYGSGNIRSVSKAFEAVLPAASVESGAVLVTSNPDNLINASHAVLPGVGAFKDCIKGLSGIPGMIDALERHVFDSKKPFLGVCVGMQLLADCGYEHGRHKGLGWIKGDVRLLEPADKTLKIPHMGWNDTITKPLHMFDDLGNNPDFYYTHSYHLETHEQNIAATTDYGGRIVAAVRRDNIFATQFHPEKSQRNGLRLLSNFLQTANYHPI